MAYYPTNVLDNQIKALPTIATASGSVANFTTDKAENLVECEVQIVATGGGGTPTTPIPIVGYSACNLSHSDADTSNPTVYNIPFGQTIYGGVLNVGSGVLRVTHRYVDLSTLTWIYNSSAAAFFSADDIGEYRGVGNLGLCEIYTVVDNVSAISNLPATNYIICGYTSTSNHRLYVRNTDYTDETAFTNSMSGKYFAYRLATSTEIQLDSTAIQTIANSENNIWADTGDISVQFVLSVGEYVNQNT